MWFLMTFPGLSGQEAAEFEARRAVAGTEAAAQIKAEEAAARLSSSLAGRFGRMLTPLTDPLGFNWRANVALVGGFAAKEVVLSTLGTAYSVGEVETDQGASLSQRLRRSPEWSPLVALVMIIFVMVYAPRFVTLAVIRREAGWGWAGFSMLYSTAFAYGLALGVYQSGRLLGLD